MGVPRFPWPVGGSIGVSHTILQHSISFSTLGTYQKPQKTSEKMTRMTRSEWSAVSSFRWWLHKVQCSSRSGDKSASVEHYSNWSSTGTSRGKFLSGWLKIINTNQIKYSISVGLLCGILLGYINEAILIHFSQVFACLFFQIQPFGPMTMSPSQRT